MSPDDKLFGYEIRLQYDEHGNVNLAPLFNLWRGGMGRSASSESRLNDPSDDFTYDYQPFALDRNSVWLPPHAHNHQPPIIKPGTDYY